MSDQVKVGILSAGVAILTIIVTSVVQIIIRYQTNKHDQAMTVLKDKIEAYQDIFRALEIYREYFLLFVDTGNEFAENCDLEDFAPLEPNSKFVNVYYENLLFIESSLQKKLRSLIDHGSALHNLAIGIANDKAVSFVVPAQCERMITEIDGCVDQIKTELGV